MAAANADKLLGGLGRGLFALGGAFGVVQTCTFNVDGGERVLIMNMFKGLEDKVRGEGTHLQIPWVMRPITYNIRLRPKLIQTTTGTKDLQMVTIHIRLLYKPDIAGLPKIHKSLGQDYDERVLPAIANEVMKATIAHYDAEQLLTQRETVSKDIREAIVARALNFDILIDDVSITHLTYGRDFTKAIEEKQVAEQDAERQKFHVLQADQERLATIIRSEGEAEAAEMISSALKEHGSGLIEVRRIDAAKEIAESLSKSPNVMYLPAGQNMLLNMAGGAKAQ